MFSQSASLRSHGQSGATAPSYNTSATYKDKPTGDYMRCGNSIIRISWRSLIKWVICAVVLVLLCDFVLESIDHVLSEHGDVHSRHAELLEKGLQNDIEQKMFGTPAKKSKSPTYSTGSILPKFCTVANPGTSETITSVPTGFWHPVRLNEGEMPASNAVDSYCNWRDATDTVIPFALCTYAATQDPHISKSILENGLWNPMKKDTLQFALPKNNPNRRVVIDVGANLGFYTLMAATRGYDVIAIEPSEESATRLLFSLERNEITVPDISSMDRAPKIKDKDRESSVWVFVNAAFDQALFTPFSYFEENPGASYISVGASGQRKIDTVILDELITSPIFHLDPRDIHMIKISAEMSDVRVLHGARRILAQGAVPFVALVFNEDHIKNQKCDPVQMLRILRDYGYKLYQSNVYYLTDEAIDKLVEEAKQSSWELLFVGPDSWF